MQLRSGRRPQAAEEDRISSLPDDLLLDVLARLRCAHAAARTSVIARRWRGLWTRLPELTFRGVDPSYSLADVLAQVTSPALNLLHIDIDCNKSEALFHVSSLLRAAGRLAPKHLLIAMVEYSDETVELPCFGRTTSLILCLPQLALMTPPLAGEFTALQRLDINTYNEELGSLLPLCPNLRSLQFYCWCSDELIVHSTSLEELNVDTLDNEIQNIDIVAPLLKKARFSIARGEYFSVSFSASMVEEFRFECWLHNVGQQNMCLRNLKYYLAHGVHELHLDILFYKEYVLDANQSFGEMIQQLPFSQFSTLVLHLRTGKHAFGPLVLHLLQIRPVQMLSVKLHRESMVTVCSLLKLFKDSGNFLVSRFENGRGISTADYIFRAFQIYFWCHAL